MFFFATLQTSIIAAILSHKASKWQLKWDLELLNIFIGVSTSRLTIWSSSLEHFNISLIAINSPHTKIAQTCLVQGALNSGLANFFLAICARLKGPVFVSSFSPLGLLFATILESIFLGHQLSTGRYCFYHHHLNSFLLSSVNGPELSQARFHAFRHISRPFMLDVLRWMSHLIGVFR